MNADPGTLSYLGIEPSAARYSMLDLFAGAGGLSLGLSWAGFESVGAVEMDRDAAATYDANFGDHVLRDENGEPCLIEAVDFSGYRGKVDLVVGGPPCQGFSQLGKGLKEDPRNRLWREYIRAVKEVRPSAFLMENVPPILKAEEGVATVKMARRLGYDVVFGVLRAEDHGVPQKRRRAFILGVRGGVATLPRLDPAYEVRTVRWALNGLSLRPSGADWHVGRNPTGKSLDRYRTVPEGGNRFDLMRERPDITPRCWLEKPTGSSDVFGRLWWDQPSLTIRTEFFKPEKGRYLHPEAQRSITHREAARLQTFPDDFRFVGNRVPVARQIGNAVPPVLAYRLGMEIRAAWESSGQRVSGQPNVHKAT